MPDEYDNKKDEQHCVIKNPLEYAGVIFLVLGFLGSGVLLIIAGQEMVKSSPDFELIEIVYIVGAIFFLLGMIGYYMNMPSIFCANSDRGVMYFGNMFILLGFFGIAGFMFGTGLAFYDPAAPVPENVRDFGYISGVFCLLFAIGWLIVNAEKNMACNDQVFVHTIGHYLIVIFLIVAGGLFFGFGNLFGEGDVEDAGHVLIVIAVSYILIAVGLFCCSCL